MGEWEKEFNEWELKNFGGSEQQRSLLKVGFKAGWNIQQKEISELKERLEVCKITITIHGAVLDDLGTKAKQILQEVFGEEDK